MDAVTNAAPAAAPAGVLVVHLRSRRVVHANSTAEQLAPGVALPAPLQEWSSTAALRDLDGGELRADEHPLARLARSQPVEGQAVSAERASDLGPRREPLWVVALPLDDAPGLEGHALVVFLPLRDQAGVRAATDAATGAAPDAGAAVMAGQGGADSAASKELRAAAVLATGHSFTVADARQPDVPLVWVNPAFSAGTGYSAEEAVGRNCRFLQGPGTDPRAPAAMREAIAAGRAVTTTLLNYRKDGSAYWNQLSLSPIRDAAGELTHYVGVQSDVTGKVLADAERDQALEAERTARRQAEAARAEAEAAQAEAEAAHDRLVLLAEVTSALSGVLDDESAVTRLAQLVVPLLADWCVVSLVDDAAPAPAAAPAARRGGRAPATAPRGLRDVGSWHVDPGLRAAAEEYARVRLAAASPGAPLLRAVQTGEPVLIPSGAAQRLASALVGERARELVAQLAPSSSAAFPLRGRGRTVGVLSLFTGASRGALSEEELLTAREVAARAGVALDAARLYRQQRDLAAGLQRSLLTRPPEPDHLQVAVRYAPAAEAAQVGGDWYDALLQADGGTVLVIGDVVGHDTQAAAAMGQLRTITRTTARITGDGPAGVLAAVDAALVGLQVVTTASAVVARLEQSGEELVEGVARLRWSNAGHPPPMVVHADATATVLDGHPPDLILGVLPTTRRQEHEVVLERGATVLMYTDGLVERRTQSLEVGLGLLQRTLAELAAEDLPLEELLDAVLERMLPPTPEDDVALIAVRLHPQDRPRPPEAGGQRVPPGLPPEVDVEGPPPGAPGSSSPPQP